jgi:hypothetical protein
VGVGIPPENKGLDVASGISGLATSSSGTSGVVRLSCRDIEFCRRTGGGAGAGITEEDWVGEEAESTAAGSVSEEVETPSRRADAGGGPGGIGGLTKFRGEVGGEATEATEASNEALTVRANGGGGPGGMGGRFIGEETAVVLPAVDESACGSG